MKRFYKITSNQSKDWFNLEAEEYYTIEYIEREDTETNVVFSETDRRYQYGEPYKTFEEAFTVLKGIL